MLTRAGDVAVLAPGAGVAAPVLVVDLEQPVVPGAVFVHPARLVRAASALVLHQTHPWEQISM